MTMQAAMHGMYPPKGWGIWRQNDTWQPIPMQINDPVKEILFIDCELIQKAT